MSEETTVKKTVSKKAPSKKAPTSKEPAKPVAIVKKAISFFFPNGDHSVFVWTRADKEGNRLQSSTVRVESKMICMRPTDPDYDFVVEKLRANKGNKANGGNRFAEVATGKMENSSIADRIDQLNAMDKSALVAMLGGDIILHRLTVGALIAKALDLD